MMNEIIIEGGKRDVLPVSEMWRYRDLFFFLAWRDMLVRYKQTVLGIGWVLVRPLVTMIVFSILFGRIAGFSSGGVPYPLFVFVALLPWQFFSDSLFFGHGSLVANSSLISKVYFPRIFIPASAVVCCLVDFAISFLLLLIMMLWYGCIPNYRLFFIPLLLIWSFLFSSAVTVFVAALTVRYRDFKYIVSFALQLGMYVSPIGFSDTVIPISWRLVYALNPLVGIIHAFRWALVKQPLVWQTCVISLLVTFFFLVISLLYFQKAEESFADII